MKIFRCNQVRKIDQLTIAKEPIDSIDLMERASVAITKYFVSHYSSTIPIYIFAGNGNNGGDGIAVARLLTDIGYDVQLFVLHSENYSVDNHININRLIQQGIVNPVFIKSMIDFPFVPVDAIIVDALFGSGLARPLEGLAADIVHKINSLHNRVVSIDIPSGLFGEENPCPNTNPVVESDVTLSLQFPKLSFMFAENYRYVGNWSVLDIGLHPKVIDEEPTTYFYLGRSYIESLIEERGKFYHKGNFGHSLIIAGSYGMMGAAILSTKACLKAGSGLVTASIPSVGYSIMQQSVPEALVKIDDNNWSFSGIVNPDLYSSIGVGPGLGKSNQSDFGFRNLLKDTTKPMVIDADGLNIIADNPAMLGQIPKNSIITPHIGEFNRLFGRYESGFKRLEKAKEVALKYQIFIVIKGANSSVVCPDGRAFFNSSGNPGMATAGSGDVLTGIITSLLGQGYSSMNSAIIGVYLHGLAGDIAAGKVGEDALNALDIINCIGEAFTIIRGISNF